jgi:hypothetical protein
MASDAVLVEATFDGGVPIAPAVPMRTLAASHEKNLDIGSGHNTRTAWSSMREKRIQKKKRNKKICDSVATACKSPLSSAKLLCTIGPCWFEFVRQPE